MDTEISLVELEQKTASLQREAAGGTAVERLESADVRARVEKMLGHGSIYVLADTEVEGFDIDPALPGMKEGVLLPLTFSRYFRVKDLVVDDFGLKQTLHFSGKPALVSLPWEGVKAVSSPTTGEVLDLTDDDDGDGPGKGAA